jgi:DNA primase
MKIDILANSVQDGESRRFDCPFCGGNQSLSISKNGNKILYNCFRAICAKNGSVGYVPSLDALKSRLNAPSKAEEKFFIPDYWVHGVSSEKTIKMLLKTNSYEAYKNGNFRVAYDPREDRLVYLVQDVQGSMVGAVGRTLSNAVPKTLNYPGSAPVPFNACGKSCTKLVIVEDCASACAISEIPGVRGMALLGTYLRKDYIPFMARHLDVYIALDYDARKKALDMKQRLLYYCKKVNVIILDKDIKDMTLNERENLFYAPR